MIQGDGGYILQWNSDSKYNVNLKIVSRYAIIESNAAGDAAKSEATINAHRIIGQITKLLKTGAETHDRSGYSTFNLYN
jgi:hypothetical protein